MTILKLERWDYHFSVNVVYWRTKQTCLTQWEKALLDCYSFTNLGVLKLETTSYWLPLPIFLDNCIKCILEKRKTYLKYWRSNVDIPWLYKSMVSFWNEIVLGCVYCVPTENSFAWYLWTVYSFNISISWMCSLNSMFHEPFLVKYPKGKQVLSSRLYGSNGGGFSGK